MRAGNEIRGFGNGTRCLLCGASLAVSSRGRPPKFCSPAHRVAYHRGQRRAPPASTLSTATAETVYQALDAMIDALGMVEPLRGAARLRNLAEQAVDAAHLLDQVRTHGWALEDLPHVEWAFDRLAELEAGVARIVTLDTVADDLEELVTALSEVRAHSAELEEAREEARELASSPSSRESRGYRETLMLETARREAEEMGR